MRPKILLLSIGAALLGLAVCLAFVPASAAPAPAQTALTNAYCLGCHGTPGLTMQLPDGNVLSLYVDKTDYNKSIHGTRPQQCIECHTGVGEYGAQGHASRPEAKTRRAVTQEYNLSCQPCHAEQFDLVQFSAHATAQSAGNLQAAFCSDCHTAHAVRRLTDPNTGELLENSRLLIPQMCAQCHNAIYEKYRDSVHGAALVHEKNTDVPTCIDCHGVHNIGDPTTAAFRLNSPQLCAGCHTDPQRMDKYGISTEVLNTYVADFHGTTVTIFENVAPDAATNKPVCFDCHGVHDIIRPDDPVKGLRVRENLLARCQACHPDATIDFPEAWLSHYIPAPDKYPMVYYVNLFYKFFIPAVLGGMGALVAMDLGRSLVNRYAHTRAVQWLGRVFRRKPAARGKREVHHG